MLDNFCEFINDHRHVRGRGNLLVTNISNNLVQTSTTYTIYLAHSGVVIYFMHGACHYVTVMATATNQKQQQQQQQMLKWLFAP